MQYPFDENKALIDRQGFEVLSKYFAVRDDLAEARHGMFSFKWGDGWQKLQQLPVEQLCEAAVFLFCYDHSAFYVTTDAVYW